MSFNFQYNGTVNQTLWQNVTANCEGCGNAPFPASAGQTISVSPDTEIINWSQDLQDLPSFLLGSSVSSLVSFLSKQTLNWVIQRTLILTISSGTQAPEASSTPTIYINYGFEGGLGNDFNLPNLQWLKNPGTDTLNQYSYCYPTSNICPIQQTTLGNISQEIYPNILITVQFVPWNQCGNVVCVNQTVNDLTINLEMQVTLNISCTNSNLNTNVCLQSCETVNAIKNGTCFQEYLGYCFSNITGSTGPVIFENDGDNQCNNYFENYLQNGPGPNPNLDKELNETCSFITDLDKFNEQSQNIQNICACHIDQTFYDNIEKSINSLPGGNVVDIPAQCLFPPCVNTVYKPNLTGKTCPVAPCINIADIQNNGNIQGGTTINQSCLNTKTSIEKYLIFIVPSVIIILIVIAVIIFLIIKKN